MSAFESIQRNYLFSFASHRCARSAGSHVFYALAKNERLPEAVQNAASRAYYADLVLGHNGSMTPSDQQCEGGKNAWQAYQANEDLIEEDKKLLGPYIQEWERHIVDERDRPMQALAENYPGYAHMILDNMAHAMAQMRETGINMEKAVSAFSDSPPQHSL